MGKTLAITDQEFALRVLGANQLVVVDFWAPWCPPCRAIAPILEELAGEYEGKLTIAKINTDEHSQYSTQYNVQSIPTMIFFKNGQEVDRVIGAGPKGYYKSKIDPLL